MSAEAPALLRLDALAEADADLLHGWRGSAALVEGALGHPFPTSRADELAWIRGFAGAGPAPRDVCLAIRRGSEAGLLGYVQLRAIDWLSGVAEVGLVVGDPAARGTGVGKAALRLLMDLAVRQLRLRRLWLRVPAYNAAAIRLYEGAGFRAEGRLVRHVLRRGDFQDVLLYGWEAPPGSN